MGTTTAHLDHNRYHSSVILTSKDCEVAFQIYRYASVNRDYVYLISCVLSYDHHGAYFSRANVVSYNHVVYVQVSETKQI